MPKAESVLADLARRRAVLMDQVQAIDDDAAKLLPDVQLELETDEAALVRRQHAIEAHWGHLQPRVPPPDPFNG